jgi:hypothetical protein
VAGQSACRGLDGPRFSIPARLIQIIAPHRSAQETQPFAPAPGLNMEVHLKRALDAKQRQHLTVQLLELDPAAMVDVDRLSGHLRIGTLASSQELLALLRTVAPQLDPADLEYIPSNCCGGCGG